MNNKKQPQQTEPKSSGASKPISFHPLSFDESLDALLSIEPPPKGEAPKKSEKKSVKNPKK